jgi:hypothetical protein
MYTMYYTFTEFVELSNRYLASVGLKTFESDPNINLLCTLNPTPDNIKIVTEEVLEKIKFENHLLYFLWIKNPQFCYDVTELELLIYTSIMKGEISIELLYTMCEQFPKMIYGDRLVLLRTISSETDFGKEELRIIQSMDVDNPAIAQICNFRMTSK